MDLKELSGNELDQLEQDVLAEQERRQALATIPDQIAELARKYVDGGGDPGNLTLD